MTAPCLAPHLVKAAIEVGCLKEWASPVFVICPPNGLAKARCWVSSTQ